MDKPEALRLEDVPRIMDNANAELRRLHAENERLHQANEAFSKRQEWWNEKMFALEAQRDALLEALKYHQEQTRPIQRTLDVIKAVEREKK